MQIVLSKQVVGENKNTHMTMSTNPNDTTDTSGGATKSIIGTGDTANEIEDKASSPANNSEGVGMNEIYPTYQYKDFAAKSADGYYSSEDKELHDRQRSPSSSPPGGSANQTIEAAAQATQQQQDSAAARAAVHQSQQAQHAAAVAAQAMQMSSLYGMGGLSALGPGRTLSDSHSMRLQKFPAKLDSILSRPEWADIITWMPHGRSWKILKPHDFETLIMPLYFDHCNYHSFNRLVNAWAFRRMSSGPDRGSYWHELFLRGRPNLHRLMRRLPKSQKKAPMSKEDEPDFYSMEQLEPLPASEAAAHAVSAAAQVGSHAGGANSAAEAVGSPSMAGSMSKAYYGMGGLGGGMGGLPVGGYGHHHMDPTSFALMGMYGPQAGYSSMGGPVAGASASAASGAEGDQQQSNAGEEADNNNDARVANAMARAAMQKQQADRLSALHANSMMNMNHLLGMNNFNYMQHDEQQQQQQQQHHEQQQAPSSLSTSAQQQQQQTQPSQAHYQQQGFSGHDQGAQDEQQYLQQQLEQLQQQQEIYKKLLKQQDQKLDDDQSEGQQQEEGLV